MKCILVGLDNTHTELLTIINYCNFASHYLLSHCLVQVRERFLAILSSNKKYAYLKRVAVEAQKKRSLQQRKAATTRNNDASFGGPFANPKLSDFLYQVGSS